MFKGAAKKLQYLCYINVFVCALAGVIYGFMFLGIIGAIVSGCLFFFIGWASSLFMYAFSELCIDVAQLNNRIIEEDDDDDDDDDE